MSRPPGADPAGPARRPHLGSPPRRPPPVIPTPDPHALARQRRFALGMVALSGVALMLSLTMKQKRDAAPPALPALPLPLPADAPLPAPPWDDARVASAAGASARAAEACLSRHAQGLGALEGELSLVVHLPPAGPIDARLEGAQVQGATLPAEAAACLGAAAAVEPWPRPIGDRQVRLPLYVVGPLKRRP